MRLRNNPQALDILASHPDIVIANPTELKGIWQQDIFKNNNPIHIEIGMGKGMFVIQKALQNPHINYVGIEKYATVCEIALKKTIKHNSPSNLRLLNIDAEILEKVFAHGEVGKIYLNFSDPWPKARHEKRRLLYKTKIDLYKKISSPNTIVEFKTDNDDLFSWAVEHLKQLKLNLKLIETDLHNSKHQEGNIMTEYEKKFASTGKNINKLVLIL